MRFVLATALIAAIVTAQPAAAQTSPSPSPSDAAAIPVSVFRPSFREAIDPRCPKAKADADAIAANIDGISVPALAASEQDFLACSKQPRLPSKIGETLYYQLAAAVAFYLIGTRTAMPTEKTAYSYARQLIDVLAPETRKVLTANSTPDDSAYTGGGAFDPSAIRAIAADLAPVVDAALASLPK
jgi:hypothetical protein